jgi:hypothetical protein
MRLRLSGSIALDRSADVERPPARQLEARAEVDDIGPVEHRGRPFSVGDDHDDRGRLRLVARVVGDDELERVAAGDQRCGAIDLDDDVRLVGFDRNIDFETGHDRLLFE